MKPTKTVQHGLMFQYNQAMASVNTYVHDGEDKPGMIRFNRLVCSLEAAYYLHRNDGSGFQSIKSLIVFAVYHLSMSCLRPVPVVRICAMAFYELYIS
jgi:hypothetical protein